MGRQKNQMKTFSTLLILAFFCLNANALSDGKTCDTDSNCLTCGTDGYCQSCWGNKYLWDGECSKDSVTDCLSWNNNCTMCKKSTILSSANATTGYKTCSGACTSPILYCQVTASTPMSSNYCTGNFSGSTCTTAITGTGLVSSCAAYASGTCYECSTGYVLS